MVHRQYTIVGEYVRSVVVPVCIVVPRSAARGRPKPQQ